MKLSDHLAKKTLSDGWEWPSNCTALRIFTDGSIWHLNGHFATKTEQTDITGVAGICRHEDYLVALGA